jgi:hypothetical protein
MRLNRNAKATTGIETAKLAQRTTILDQGAAQGPVKKDCRFFPKPPVLDLPSRTESNVVLSEHDSVKAKIDSPS